MDKVVILEAEKEQVKKIVPVDYKNTIDTISDLDLLKYIKFLYSRYPSEKDLSLENKISLRENVNHVLRLYNINEDTFKILVNILETRRAL